MRGCGRQGIGEPPLCDICVQRLYPGRPAADDDPIAQVVNTLLDHDRAKEVVAKVAGGVDVFASFLDNAMKRAFDPKPPPPPPPPPVQSRRPITTARVILGFRPDEKLTVEQVKKRHKELALKHHPDRGGDPAKMTNLNRARDALLAELGGK
jgi:hypothetical protein